MKKNDNIDIKKSNTEISNLRCPIVFLFNIISWRNELNDNNLSICLRLYLKNHSIIALENDFKTIFSEELLNFKKSREVLRDFYKLMDKKLALILILKKWHSVYDKKEFWELNITEQNDYLQQVKDRFLSIYDCSHGGLPYYIKLANLLKNTKIRYEILEEGKNRLKIIFEMFGSKLFQSLEIPIITVSEYYQLTDNNILIYFEIIYEKFLELLNQTIKLFDSYNLVCIQLDNLINPTIVKINSTIFDSETEGEDIQNFM